MENNFFSINNLFVSLVSGLLLTGSLLTFTGCATTSSQAVNVEKPVTAQTRNSYTGPRAPMVIGKFDNRSDYMRGLFSDGNDRLGGQAKTILMGHLQQTGRFILMDRDNMDEIARESQFKNQKQKIRGADYAITGDVVEFGRKEVGDRELFGVLGSGKQQIAYSKVTLNVVNTQTSEVVYSASGAGEYKLSNREIIGFGGTAGYDATLNGKVLDLAIREAVDRLVEGLERGEWSVSKS